MLTRLIIALTIITIAICVIFSDVISVWLQVVAIIIAVFLMGVSGITLWIGTERARSEREDRLLKENQRKAAGFTTQIDGYGMLHLINIINGHTQNLTLDARAYRNGHYEAPTPDEVKTLHAILASRHSTTTPKMVVEGSTTAISQVVEVDLLAIFTQPSQSYAFIAGQQVGKTFQARRIAQHWINSGITPIVIAPKWDRGEWEGCRLFGGEYDFDKVAGGMRRIEYLAQTRHANKEMSHKEHPLQPVFFDDWTGIRAKLEQDAEKFIVDATTFYASVNIILYFMLHADTAATWGVGKVGAALHQNFIKLFIEPGFNEAGMIDRTRNVGWLLMAGQSKKDRRQVRLFNGVGQPLLIPDYVNQPVTIQPRDSDALFVDLVKIGRSRNEASLEAWGRTYAGNLVERGKRLLGEIE
jgi:hypothetical protein